MGRKRKNPMEIKKSITITLETQDVEKIVKLAKEKGVTVNQYISKIVENLLNE